MAKLKDVVVSDETIQVVMKPVKRIDITYYTEAPKFVFTGEWIGKDITLVIRLLARAYRSYKRDQRRAK
jgi:hypothetical protein